MFFLGSVEYQMDDRNRVPIPPRYREQFDAPAVMTSGKERCVAVYTQSGFEEAAAVVRALPVDSEEGRRARRFFFGHAFSQPRDAQSRLLVPRELVEYAGLDKDLVVIGCGEWFEIWDKQTWLEHESAEGEGA